MTCDELLDLVEQMRALQREFFRTRPADRKPDLLARSRMLEARVDAGLRARRAPAAQPNLFGEGGT